MKNLITSKLFAFVLAITLSINPIFCEMIIVNNDESFIYKIGLINRILRSFKNNKFNEYSNIEGMSGKYPARIQEFIDNIHKLRQNIMNNEFNKELDNRISEDAVYDKSDEQRYYQDKFFDKFSDCVKGKRFDENNKKDDSYLLERSILLYGKPGNGKTKLAENIAKEINGIFVHIKSSLIVGSYTGEGPHKIEQIFKDADNLVRGTEKIPVVLFFDEVDAVARKFAREDYAQHNDSYQTLNMCIDQYLKSNPLLTVICATNKYQDLQEAFKSRFGVNCIEIKNPDKESRHDIIKSFCSNHKIYLEQSLLDDLVRISGDMSVRDIEKSINLAFSVKKPVTAETLKDAFSYKLQENKIGTNVFTIDNVYKAGAVVSLICNLMYLKDLVIRNMRYPIYNF